MSIEGKTLTVQRQRARRAVVAGKARWLDSKPAVTEVRQPTRPPVRHPRGAERRFGAGILATNPVYRAPVDLDSMAWWEAQNALEAERDLQRRFEEFRAMERLSMGLEPY